MATQTRPTADRDAARAAGIEAAAAAVLLRIHERVDGNLEAALEEAVREHASKRGHAVDTQWPQPG